MMHEPPTGPQVDFVRALQKQVRLPNYLLDAHCQATFRKSFADLSKRECSQLIDEMQAWKSIPAELQRVQGQRDLPGFGS